MKFLPLLLVLGLASPVLLAQKSGQTSSPTAASTPSSQSTPPPTNIPMWRCNLPGGSYSVALRAIVSVSKHEYVVDGAARVTEVNIDTMGVALARFYFIEPNSVNAPLGIGAGTIEKAQQLFQQGADASNQDIWKRVVKNYPTTTHARTIEYRIEDKDTLTKLFDSAESALRLNKNTVFAGN